ATLRARVDQIKDPADVYRALVPAHGTLTLRVGGLEGDVAVRVWGPRTPTILERGAVEKRDLLGSRAFRSGGTLQVANASPAAQLVYVDVSAGVSRTASYTLRLSARG